MKFRIQDTWGEINAVLESDDIVDVIYKAWNYEAEVYIIDENGLEDLIFSGWEENDILSEWLEPFGVRIIDGEHSREIQTIATGEIHTPPWKQH